MNDLPGKLERLTDRLNALERRVTVLESPFQALATRSLAAPDTPVPSLLPDSTPLSLSGGTFTVLGKSLLGIAGAYLLRAVEQSTDLPKLGVAGVALIYAVIWLIWAARSPRDRWFESTVFACTSAAILAPMLWELTLTFRVLRPEGAAALLVGYVAVASALAWKRDRAPVVSVAYLSSIAAAFALSLGTQALLPFTAVTFSIVALCELAALRDRRTGARMIAAVAADVMIWAILFIYTGPQSSRTSYPALGTLSLVTPAMVLFVMVAAGVIVKTVSFRKQISPFETVQTTIAFVLAAVGFSWLVPRGIVFLGWACLGLSVFVSVMCFQLFARREEPRNFFVFAWWAFALFVSGALVGLTGASQIILLATGAVCATLLGVRMARPVLQYQGLLLLLLVAGISGAARFATDCLIGTIPDRFPWSLLIIAISAGICYVLPRPADDESRRPQVLRLITGFLIVSAIGAILAQGLASLIGLAIPPGAHHIALVRTGVICFLALMLAFSGRRWRRPELTGISYAALVVVTLKLLVEDLRNPRLEFIAASIFLVAGTLLVVPRISRLPRRS
jgi:hypothetical protein